MSLMKPVAILFFFLVVILLIVVSCSPRLNRKDNEALVDTYINQKMKESQIVGLAAAILINKKVVWMKGWGSADLKNNTPFTAHTITNIASISKTITGACVMQLVEANKVSLDEDINTYLPFRVTHPFFPAKKITLRQLATHTSGITDRSEIYDSTYNMAGKPQESLGDFLANYFKSDGKYYSQDNFIKNEPGSRYEYSNIGAGLAGFIVETVTGEGLNEYSRKHIFAPLSMNETGWFISEIDSTKHTRLYYYNEGQAATIPWYELTTYPDGGVRTSVSDLGKFFSCILNEGELDGVRILKAESVKTIVNPQFNKSNKPENLKLKEENTGIFWGLEDKESRWGHSGSDPGVNTEMYYEPANQIGVIMFMNTDLDESREKEIEAIENRIWKWARSLKQH